MEKDTETRAAKIKNLLSPVSNLSAMILDKDSAKLQKLILDEAAQVKKNIPKIVKLLNELDEFN